MDLSYARTLLGLLAIGGALLSCDSTSDETAGAGGATTTGNSTTTSHTGGGTPTGTGTGTGTRPQDLGLVGFGTESRFAYADPGVDPTIMIVDRLTASQDDGDGVRGSLAYCLAQDYPRVILFETSGTIDMRDAGNLRVDSGACWVVGQSAPDPGVEVLGTTLWLAEVSDILFTHMTFGLSDINTGSNADDQDSVTIYDSHNVVFDHCTVRWGTDETFSTAPLPNGSDITISNSLVYEPLRFSNRTPKSSGGHAYGSLSQSANMTWYRNLIAFGDDRNPWVRVTGQYAVINNVHWGYFRPGTMVGEAFGDPNASSGQIDIAIVGEWVYRHMDYAGSSFDEKAGVLRPDLAPGSRLFIHDLAAQCKDDGDDDWGCISNTGDFSNEAQSPVDIAAYEVLSSSEVKGWVLDHAGPVYRDAHDLLVIGSVRDAVMGARDTCDSPSPLPARAIHWGDPAGDVSGGHDWSTGSQSFAISVQGGPSVVVTLDANCADEQDVVTHINARLAAAGATGVEAFVIWHGDETERYVGLRTTATGADQQLVISSSTATAIDLVDGSYAGRDGLGHTPRAVHTVSHTIPDDPHQYDGALTQLEIWILTSFAGIGI